MSIRFTSYREAYTEAVDLARRCNHNAAIRSVKEYGKAGYNVTLASSLEANTEIVTPRHPRIESQTKTFEQLWAEN